MTSSRRHHLKVTSTLSLLPVILLSHSLAHHFNPLLCLSHVVLQSLMLQIAANWIEQEKKDIEEAKETYMADNCPTPDLSGDQAALMVGSGVEGECRGRGGF